MARHTITHADEHLAGDGQAGGINGARRGIPVSLMHRQVITDALLGDIDGLILPAGSGATPGPGAISPIDGAFADANGVGVIEVARNLSVLSSNAGDTTQTITVTGTDIAGKPLVEDIALNGTTEAVGVSAFKTVTAISIDAVMAGNLSMGTSVTAGNTELGLDARLLNPYDVLHSLVGSTGAADAGTFTVADQTDPPTAVTGDARGTYQPAVALDGTEDIVLYYIPDFTKEGYGVNFSG